VTQVFPENMKKSLTPDMLATDLAEYLVRRGVRLPLPSADLSSLAATGRRPRRRASLTLSLSLCCAQIPFRETHHISGSCIRLSEESGVPLSQLTLEQFKSVSPHFGDDVHDVFNFETSVERRDAKGGTSRRAVLEQVEELKKKLVATAQD